MKKIFLAAAVCTLVLQSCKKDDVGTTIEKVSIETQNDYDIQAAKKYLDEHYLDAKGNIKTFSTTDTSDDNYKKLSELNPVTLPSGVIYIMRVGAQPNPGTAIGSNDIISLLTNTMTYIATKTDNVVSYNSGVVFTNSLNSTGIPEKDPSYYYVKNSVLKAYNDKYTKTYDHSYYEIEGFREALQIFKAYNNDNSADYNLQGVIIVPSKAAFARDPHYNYSGISLNDRSFVFNFQVYKTIPRPSNQD